MNVTGIITEYNPFHNGHLYHLTEAKKATNADAIVCVMSGNFVQRGGPAIIDKWKRTEMALNNGVDLIIELPTYYAVSSAEFFAKGSVSILHNLGIVNNLFFGSECGDVEKLSEISKTLVNEDDKFKTLIKEHLSKGDTFAKAREKSLIEYLKDDAINNIVTSSNNILGIEYIKSIMRLNSTIIPSTLKREGSNYNDKNLSNSFSSATSIRELLKNEASIESLKNLIPNESFEVFENLQKNSYPFVFDENMFKFIKYKIQTKCINFNNLYEITEGLENKIIKEKDLPSYYDTYLKKYTMKNDLRLEIDRMRKYSILYTKLFTKEVISTSDEIYVRNIKMINQLGQQACHSFLMDYMYYVSDESRLDYITSLIEKMMLRRIVCSRSTKQLDGIFRDIIKTKFKNGYEYNDTEIYNIIIDNIPSDVEFANTLKEKVWDANEITNYILRKFEYELSGKSLSKEFVIRSRKDVHIEHIIPVNFDSEWPKELNLQGEKSQYDILTSKLGNLILLEFDINTSIKDSLFNVKLAKYRESTLKQVQIFINEFDKWNEEKINERTENLVELAVNIWRV